MKPLMLRIKGLNSFKEEQVIDFKRLTDSGLFGIFGPTGCGKSSILDAITYALYGKIIRDSSGFINVTEETVEVTYEFEIGAGKDRKTYIVDRAAKKEKKKDGYKTSVVRLREKVLDEIAIASEGKAEVDKHIEGVIGLTLDDFTRAVVLPQGRFSEFLKTKPSDRRDMLERIFGLQKFGRGLGDKIKSAKRLNKEKLDKLEGKLSQYVGVVEEELEKLKVEYTVLVEEEKLLKESKKLLDEQYEKFKVVWELQEELKIYENRFNALIENTHAVNEKKLRFQKGSKALIVKPLISDVENTEKEIRLNSEELENISGALAESRERLKKDEESYIKALETKNKEYPILVEKEANLKQALVIKGDLEKLKKEIKSLEDKYRSTNKSAGAASEDIAGILKERNELNDTLNSILIKINSVKIEPEYRDKVQKASSVERDFKLCETTLIELDKKIKSYTTEFEKSKVILNIEVKKQEDNNNELKVLEEKLRDLEKNYPGDNNLLLEKNQYINNLKKLYFEGSENTAKAEELSEKLIAKKAVKLELESVLQVNKNNLQARTEELKAIDEKIEKVKRNNLASIIASQLKQGDSCPVCGSDHFVKLADPIEQLELDEMNKDRSSIENSISEINILIREKELGLASIGAECSHLEKELLSIQEKLTGIMLVELKAELDSAEKSFADLKNKIDEWNKSKQLTENVMSSTKEEKAKVSSEIAKLSAEIKKDEQLIQEVSKEIKLKKQDIEVLRESYNVFKKELGIENFALRTEDISKFDIELKRLQANETEHRNNILALDKLKEEKEQIRNQYLQELERIKQSGTEKREVIASKEKEIESLAYGKQPENFIEEVRSLISEINRNEENTRKQQELSREAVQKLGESKASLEKKNETLSSIFESQIQKLKNSLKENDFNAIEEVLESYIEKSELEVLDKEITVFEEQLRDSSLNMERVRKKLKGEAIEEEQWKELQAERRAKEETLSLKVSEKARKQKELCDMEEKLSKVKQLLEERKGLEHRDSLLYELERMIQGNKLVEFVAMNQLKYVAAEASKQLKDITRGRYALELDENGGFIMRDDFNGGLRRSTSSLSGGETFLTSLSLALALSSQIQLKGRAPLEFFFLDEGFGTLDSELLDTVMDSLERLRSEKLSVGIISHVEELKNRVPIKLVVTPAQPGEGTRVRIENS